MAAFELQQQQQISHFGETTKQLYVSMFMFFQRNTYLIIFSLTKILKTSRYFLLSYIRFFLDFLKLRSSKRVFIHISPYQYFSPNVMYALKWFFPSKKNWESASRHREINQSAFVIECFFMRNGRWFSLFIKRWAIDESCISSFWWEICQ